MRQHYCVRKLKYMVFAFVLILQTIVSAQATQNSNTAGQAVPVPDWLAWKMFHQSLAFYGQRSADQVTGMLKTQFGLSPAQAAMLLQAGQSFVSTVEQLDKDSKSEAERRYPQAVPPADGSRWTRPRGSSTKTLRERFLEDGLYAEVEAKKNATLATHIQTLRRNLQPRQFDQIATWVQTTIAPRIKLFTAGTRVPNRPIPPGQPGFVARASTAK